MKIKNFFLFAFFFLGGKLGGFAFLLVCGLSPLGGNGFFWEIRFRIFYFNIFFLILVFFPKGIKRGKTVRKEND